MTRKSLRFESFTLDLERQCLRGPSGQADLRRKSFEVLRYLVEHAGRVVTKEEVMKAVWPGVTVSDESLAQSIRDVRRALSDEAHRIVKTVPRRGYLLDVPISAAATQPAEISKAPAASETLPLALPDRPSIAVLAFTNMSDHPGQEYFSDGITEDIITELSRFSELLVIARNSSFRYKGQHVDVRQIGKELGARYVLEGSVRRAGYRVRVAAQLIDATTGIHLWAERYDRKVEDIFAVQDEVARTIAALLAAHVNKAEAARRPTKPPATWRAYDYYMRAADTFSSFQTSFKAEHLYETQRLLEHALTLDPAYARAYSMLSITYTLVWNQPFVGEPFRPGVLARAYELARRAVGLDPNLPEARVALGFTFVWMHQPDAAVAEFEKAVALNPNFTDVRFAIALIYAGESERAIEVIKAHMRLDPFYIAITPGWLGFAYFVLRRYSEALPHLRECASRAPDFRAGHLWLAATYAQLGLLDEARAHVAEALRIQPSCKIEGTLTHLTPFKNVRDSKHYLDGLRKAGLPER
jgi:adenylate cyclase